MEALRTGLQKHLVTLVKVNVNNKGTPTFNQLPAKSLLNSLEKTKTYIVAPYVNPKIKEPLLDVFKFFYNTAAQAKNSSGCPELCIIVPFSLDIVMNELYRYPKGVESFTIAADESASITKLFSKQGVEEALYEDNTITATKPIGSWDYLFQKFGKTVFDLALLSLFFQYVLVLYKIGKKVIADNKK